MSGDKSFLERVRDAAEDVAARKRREVEEALLNHEVHGLLAVPILGVKLGALLLGAGVSAAASIGSSPVTRATAPRERG